MRRSVGLSSAISTVGIGGLRFVVSLVSSADQTSDRIDEFGLVELTLEQVGTGSCIESGALVGLVTARRHDHDGYVLPAGGRSDGASERKSVHARHLDIGDNEVHRQAREPGG